MDIVCREQISYKVFANMTPCNIGVEQRDSSIFPTPENEVLFYQNIVVKLLKDDYSGCFYQLGETTIYSQQYLFGFKSCEKVQCLPPYHHKCVVMNSAYKARIFPPKQMSPRCTSINLFSIEIVKEFSM